MRSRIAALFMLVATGCGSSSRPPAANATTSNAAANSKPAAAPAASAKPSIESQRGPFVEGCLENIQDNGYCDCGFAQFAEVFKDADLSKEIPKDDPRMAQLAVKMKEACSEKYPEPKTKEQFSKACTEGEPKKDPYCSCAWTELRRTLSVGEILTHQPPGTAKFAKAKQGIPKACQGKYPAELAANDYLGECKKVAQKTEKQCQCMWKKVTKKFSIEELVAGTGDMSQVPDLDKCK